MKATFKIEGMDKLKKDLEKLGKVPQKYVTTSARKGMNPVLKNAKSSAPYDEGYLKQGMILKGEKARTKGKKVYQVIFDPSMNDVFQKKNAAGDVTGYYPISQEYGYFLRDGRYMPGLRFIHDSLASNAQRSAKIMVDTMQKKIDAEARKVGLK
jgi:HK97 gp10 family phage protein